MEGFDMVEPAHLLDVEQPEATLSAGIVSEEVAQLEQTLQEKGKVVTDTMEKRLKSLETIVDLLQYANKSVNTRVDDVVKKVENLVEYTNTLDSSMTSSAVNFARVEARLNWLEHKFNDHFSEMNRHFNTRIGELEHFMAKAKEKVNALEAKQEGRSTLDARFGQSIAEFERFMAKAKEKVTALEYNRNVMDARFEEAAKKVLARPPPPPPWGPGSGGFNWGEFGRKANAQHGVCDAADALNLQVMAKLKTSRVYIKDEGCSQKGYFCVLCKKFTVNEGGIEPHDGSDMHNAKLSEYLCPESDSYGTWDMEDWATNVIKMCSDKHLNPHKLISWDIVRQRNEERDALAHKLSLHDQGYDWKPSDSGRERTGRQ
jgi:hypothetical protein